METNQSDPITAELGANLGTLVSCSIPQDYGDTSAEYRALKSGAGLIDLSPFGLWSLSGQDRLRYLHGMLSHDVKKLKAGQGRYGTLMTSNGRTICDLWVFAHENHLELLFPPGVEERAMTHLDFYLIADKADFENRSEHSIRFSLQGPEAPALLQKFGTYPAGDLDFIDGEIADIPVQIYAVDRTGQGGFDIQVKKDDAPALWQALLDAGAHAAGYGAWNMARIEAGLPWSGLELTEKVIPMEAGLTEKALSFDKGCYIGQEVVAKIKYRGKVNRLLSLIEIPDIADAEIPLMGGGKEAGWITSCARYPDGRVLALAYLRRKFIDAGDPITVGAEGQAPITLLRMIE